MTRHLAILVLGFGLLFFVRLGGVGVVDFDEANYTEISKAMYASGDLLVPYNNGEVFFEKPPFIYWTQVAGFHLFGVGSFGARALNAVAGLAVVLLLYALARRPLGPRGALLSAVVLGTALEFTVLARITLTDMWLTLWFTLCLGAFWVAVERDREGRGGLGWFLLAAVGSGLAMLTKGAIGIVLPGGAVVVYLWMVGRLRILWRPSWMLPALVITCGVGLTWYLLLGFTQPDGFAFMEELFWDHHVGRFLKPMQGHKGPFFFYLVVLVPGFLPWSALLPAAFARGGWRGLDEPWQRLVRLFLVFGVLTFVFFSIAATKLPNYILPVFPALALVVGGFLDRELAAPSWRPGKAWTWSVGIAAALDFGLAVGFVGAPFVLPEVPGWMGERVNRVPGLATPPSFGVWPWVGAATLVAAGTLLVVGFRRRSLERVLVALGGGVVAIYAFTILAIGPRVDAHFAAPLRNAAREATELTPAGERIVLVGIKRAPSVVFYGGRYTRYVSNRDEEGIRKLFAGSEPVVGITAEGYVPLLEAEGKTEVLRRELGFAVFRCHPSTPGGETTPTERSDTDDGNG